MESEFLGFEWRGKKSEWTLRNRGFSFREAARVFDDPDAVSFEDTRRNYGEQRFLTIGMAIGVLFIIAVGWTPRGIDRRIFTARSAAPKERATYAKNKKG